MCNRYAFYRSRSSEIEFERRFGFKLPKFNFSYNIPPGQYIPVVQSGENNESHFREMFWGLIPSFAEEFKPSPQFKMTNTRVEVFYETKDNFRKELLKTSRCVVPANNYFEWKGKEKIPYMIELKDMPLMTFGAIYSVWKNFNGDEHYSCSIITVPANEYLGKIHNRMPFILDTETEKVLLDNEVTDYDVLRHAIKPYPDSGLQYFQVSRKINSAMNDDPELVVPVKESKEGIQGDLFG